MYYFSHAVDLPQLWAALRAHLTDFGRRLRLAFDHAVFRFHKEHVVSQTLTWINYVRTEHLHGGPVGAILPGLPRSSMSCPIVNSLRTRDYEAATGGIDVYTFPYGTESAGTVSRLIPMPDYARQFVRAFDKGWLPEYEAAL